MGEKRFGLNTFKNILVCVNFLKSLASVYLTIMRTMGTTVKLETLIQILILSISNHF